METTVAKPVGEAHANHAAHGAAGDPKPGEAVFKQTCAMCHQTGLSGAPIPGNKQDWQARMAAGKERLYQHAIEGFTGEKGMMPAKGANAALSDADVKSAVDYMLGAVDKAS
ncbi:cytochrome c5 [Chitinivorax tropicus]|uniref:Cytochrome c5 n=1 Tax=Chitinivorax tropicus TaxID=714531 RepID=A0A840MP19_9PROT|nr:cytochrome c5 [Chitinivorax tropicus]